MELSCGWELGHPARYVLSVPAMLACLALLLDITLTLLDIDPNEFVTGSDPHFAIRLPGGSLLCYSFQGLHNTIFNLLGNDQLQMNALFVPDDTNWDNTWLGSIGVAVLYDGHRTTTLQFTAADHQVRIGERAKLDAKTVDKLSFNKGKLIMQKVPYNHTRQYPRVQVEFIDSKLDFTVGFTKDGHLDLYWHSTGIPSKTSTGVVGGFMVCTSRYNCICSSIIMIEHLDLLLAWCDSSFATYICRPVLP